MNLAIQTLKRTDTTVTIERFCVDCSIELPAMHPYTGDLKQDLDNARDVAIAFLQQLLASVEKVERKA